VNRFDDPAFMAQAKRDLVAHVDGVPIPEAWRKDNLRQPPWTQAELNTLCKALRAAGIGRYNRFLPRNFSRTPTAVQHKIAHCGGRKGFLKRYGGVVAPRS
jgi:hypothetical protein